MKLCLSVLVGLLAAVGVTQAAFPKSEIVPCAGWEDATNRLLKIDEARVSPEPAMLPGTLKLELKGTLTRDVPSLFIKADIYKVFFNGEQRTHVPCIQGYGSCVYDICELTKDAVCPPEMSSRGVPCKCPFHKFSLGEFVEDITIDKIPSLIDWIKDGDYEARAQIMESRDGPTVACFDIKAYIRSKPEVDCTSLLHKFSPKCRNVNDIVG